MYRPALPRRVSAGTAALALLLGGGCVWSTPVNTARAQNIDGDVAQFGAWQLGCDNWRICTAIAPVRAQPGGGHPAAIRLTFSARIADPQSVEIWRDDAPDLTLSPRAAFDLMQDLLARSGGELTYRYDDATSFGVPRDGFGAAATALARWRDMVPRTPLAAARNVAITPFARLDRPVPPAALADAHSRCPNGHMDESLQAWAATDGRILWRVGCGDEGLNPGSFWFVQPRPDRPPEPVFFDDRPGSDFAHNSWYDEASGLLRMTHYFGGHLAGGYDDCGVRRVYGWTAAGMELVERQALPSCGTGLAPEDWIRTYRLTVQPR